MKIKHPDSGSIRDHLFINYAREDQQFARWLALRLTAEGYRVWFDQIKLLGGESWPRDIEAAIKTRTFRMLSLMSHASLKKPVPLKERMLALEIAKRPDRQGFLIPINVSDLSPIDVDWLTSDLAFIPFASSWAKGLVQLIKLLEREQCPKADSDRRELVSRIASVANCVVATREQLTTNACRFTQVPTRLTAFLVSPKLEGSALADAHRDWACYPVSPHRVLAFHPPNEQLQTWLRADEAQGYDWLECGEIEGIPSRNVVVRLLRGCIETRLKFLGFRWSNTADGYPFPGQLGQSIRIALPDGSKTTVQHSGERTFFRVGQSKAPYRYRLAIKISVERDLFGEFDLIWQLRFDFTDKNDVPLAEGQRQSRRKFITRSWFNRHWLVRHLAAIQRCADGAGLIRVGPPGDTQVILDCNPVSFAVERGIDESILAKSEEISDDVPFEEEFESDLQDAAEEEIDDA